MRDCGHDYGRKMLLGALRARFPRYTFSRSSLQESMTRVFPQAANARRCTAPPPPDRTPHDRTSRHAVLPLIHSFPRAHARVYRLRAAPSTPVATPAHRAAARACCDMAVACLGGSCDAAMGQHEGCLARRAAWQWHHFHQELRCHPQDAPGRCSPCGCPPCSRNLMTAYPPAPVPIAPSAPSQPKPNSRVWTESLQNSLCQCKEGGACERVAFGIDVFCDDCTPAHGQAAGQCTCDCAGCRRHYETSDTDSDAEY